MSEMPEDRAAAKPPKPAFRLPRRLRRHPSAEGDRTPARAAMEAFLRGWFRPARTAVAVARMNTPHTRVHELPDRRTDADRERLARAEEKRARKAAARAA